MKCVQPFLWQVGLPVGPELVIFDEHNKQCKAGVDGQIMIRGSPLFLGYEGETDSQSFQAGGWFGTGDLGHLDKDGFLFITGRSKARHCLETVVFQKLCERVTASSGYSLYRKRMISGGTYAHMSRANATPSVSLNPCYVFLLNA